MEFENVAQFNKILEEIRPLTEQVKIYGVYKNGKEL